MKKSRLSNEEEVAACLQNMTHPQTELVHMLREIILNTDPEIGEQIKWNSPAFYYKGRMKEFDPKEYKRDIVVFNLRNPEYILLIFPTGASIPDSSGLLEGKFPDGRKTAEFSSAEQVTQRKEDLEKVIKTWLGLIEK